METLSIAILGASTDRGKFGNMAVRAYVQRGYTVFPVNPRADSVEGLVCYASLQAIPARRVNRISVYLPPAVGLSIVEEIAAIEAEQVWLNPGSHSPELVERLRDLGIQPILGCSILDIGVDPDSL